MRLAVYAANANTLQMAAAKSRKLVATHQYTNFSSALGECVRDGIVSLFHTRTHAHARTHSLSFPVATATPAVSQHQQRQEGQRSQLGDNIMLAAVGQDPMAALVSWAIPFTSYKWVCGAHHTVPASGLQTYGRSGRTYECNDFMCATACDPYVRPHYESHAVAHIKSHY